MKNDPDFAFDRFYHFLDWVVDEYGVYLFMAFVFLSPPLIVWVL